MRIQSPFAADHGAQNRFHLRYLVRVTAANVLRNFRPSQQQQQQQQQQLQQQAQNYQSSLKRRVKPIELSL